MSTHSSPDQFLAALKTLRATGEPQSVGTFRFTSYKTGFRSHQAVERIDWLTKTCGGVVERLGGMKFWPVRDAALLSVAEGFARAEDNELSRRSKVEA